MLQVIVLVISLIIAIGLFTLNTSRTSKKTETFTHIESLRFVYEDDVTKPELVLVDGANNKIIVKNVSNIFIDVPQVGKQFNVTVKTY